MITKRDIKEMMKEKYLDKTDKIIDVDIWNLEGNTEDNVWVLVKNDCNVLYFYSIHAYGTDWQKVFKGIVTLSTIETRLLHH